MKPLKIAMMSMTHGHTRKYYQVLKENPDDRIARWYLFNCEHNLNLLGEQEISYGLFENKLYEQHLKHNIQYMQVER